MLERATGMSVSDFVARTLWQPLGAAGDASWSLDSERSGFEKLESGINATARDYARFGLLFLHHGRWNDRQIVADAWVRAATSAERQRLGPGQRARLSVFRAIADELRSATIANDRR